MLKIGDFSKLSRVSVRMLRHYDEIGLLKPAKIDPFTDYRYYSEAQLPMICRITSLKDMGFKPAEICRILDFYDDKECLYQCLEERKAEPEKLAADTAQKLRLLDTAQKRLRKEDTKKYNTTIKTIPERYAACLRMVIPRYEDESMVWGILCKETDPLNMIPSEPCYCSVTFLDGEYKEKNVEVEAQKTVKGKYRDTEHVKFRTLPAVTVASCTYKGSYEQINDVVASCMEWINGNGYECCGNMFNIYHVSPHETQNPDEFVTEVCYPVCKKAE